MRWPLAFLLSLAQLSAAELTTMRGSTLEVMADLTGWSQAQGAAVLRGNYERLGLFSASGGRALSLQVDDLPPNTSDLNSLCSGAVKSYSSKAPVKMLVREQFAGKPACLFTLPGEMGRRDYYVEMLFEGRWIELHYSAPDNSGAGATAAESLTSIVGSLTAKPLAQTSALPVADITEDEIGMAEKRQNCGPKSKDFVCRALTAFRTGVRPSGRPRPVGVAGAGMVIIFGMDIGTLEPVATYMVISDSAVELGGFETRKGDDEKATRQIIRDVKSGKHPDDNNVFVKSARTLTETTPAGLAEKSLVTTTRGYVRETSMGLVFLSFTPGATGILLGVYPTP